MRFSLLVVSALISFSFAAPVLVDRGILGNIVGSLANGKANVGGIAGAIKQSIGNPKLTFARLKVVKNLATTQASLNKVKAQAGTSGNDGVTQLVATAQTSLDTAKAGVGRIGGAIIAGTKPSKTDQKDVAEGIKGTSDAISGMNAAITTPDQTLTDSIGKAATNAANLEQGGEDVLAASGESLADIGLPDNFATS